MIAPTNACGHSFLPVLQAKPSPLDCQTVPNSAARVRFAIAALNIALYTRNTAVLPRDNAVSHAITRSFPPGIARLAPRLAR